MAASRVSTVLKLRESRLGTFSQLYLCKTVLRYCECLKRETREEEETEREREGDRLSYGINLTLIADRRKGLLLELKPFDAR